MVTGRLGKLQRYWHTVRHLKWIQWRYRLKNALQSAYYRRFPALARRTLLRRLPARIECNPDGKRVSWFDKRYDGKRGMFSVADILQGRFTFLHCSKQFDGPICWTNPGFSYLWDFNLHYFEYLRALDPLWDSISPEESDRAAEAAKRFLDEWIDRNPFPESPAWHPYPLSLRIIHWIKLFVNHNHLATAKALESLYLQLLFLENSLEKHLLSNHYWENARALLFGGLFFGGRDSDRWRETGAGILLREVREQILPDGGHYERSPMYHCIVLEGLLDTYAYLTAMDRDTAWLTPVIGKMCEWLDDVTCPDGSFPLFNDAALGISATPDEILDNAALMVGYERKMRFENVRDRDQFDVLDAAPFFCVVDGAPIGPDYNPGHAHSDNFTYELFFQGQRLAVDAGTFSYDVNPARIASRSTAEHNTVVINGLEQSEVWGGFRVARRSNPTLSRAGRCGEYLVFQGEYANRVDPRQRITHERIIILKPSRWMLVWDTIQARHAIQARSLCRFAPGWTVEAESGGYALRHSGLETVCLYPLQVTGSCIRESRYAPEFGKSLPVQQLALSATGRERLETGYLFTVAALSEGADIRIVREADAVTMRLDGAKECVYLQELAR